jgi:hypothetical protein
MDAILILEKVIDDSEFSDEGFATSRRGADQEVLIEEEPPINGFFLDISQRSNIAVAEDFLNLGIRYVFI